MGININSRLAALEKKHSTKKELSIHEQIILIQLLLKKKYIFYEDEIEHKNIENSLDEFRKRMGNKEFDKFCKEEKVKDTTTSSYSRYADSLKQKPKEIKPIMEDSADTRKRLSDYFEKEG